MRGLYASFLLGAAVLLADGPRAIIVFTGDEVLPQIADGGGWNTTITLVNLGAQPASFKLYFWDDDGKALTLPIAGVGQVATLQGTIPLNGSTVIETTGTGSRVSQGWAELDTDQDIGGMAVFCQRVAGRPDYEAVVPISSRFDSRIVLAVDNTRGYVTSVALTNPSSYATATVYYTFRDEAGNKVSVNSFTLGPRTHTAFELRKQFPETANRRGTIEFLTSSLQLSALGLRFNPGGAFTSFHALSSVGWLL